jgi:hypothetical protein
MFLEPGGYIQWEDADLVHQVIKGDTAHETQLYERKSAWCFQNNIFIGILEVETNSFEYFIQALLKFGTPGYQRGHGTRT